MDRGCDFDIDMRDYINRLNPRNNIANPSTILTRYLFPSDALSTHQRFTVQGP
jgi:hypothetical protein